jgi:transcriptional regulator with XRE-family HTH domain
MSHSAEGKVPETTLSPWALALAYLRSASGWTKAELARALGLKDESLLSAYERGAKPLAREQLESLVEPLGHSPEALEVLLAAHELLFPAPSQEAPSPAGLSPGQVRAADRAALAAAGATGRIAAREVRSALLWRWKRETAEAARRNAEGLLSGLMAGNRRERRALVEIFPDYWDWALSVRVCEESVRQAAHRPEEALELAELALSIARRAPGEESWRSRLEGYCWAHVANARRVANDLSGADEAFARAWELWRAGADSEPPLLPEWCLFSLEASLRKDERRLPEALKLLHQARDASEGEPLATGRILLLKESVFSQMGETQSALAALAEAAPFVEASGDRRLLFALRFRSVDHLYHLGRHDEAAGLLPRVRELAIRQGKELDLLRVVWLTARVAAGQGRTEEAIAGLEQVGREFTARELPYNAALCSLDLATLWLRDGRTAEVKALAMAMGWIFQAQGIDREALAALGLFRDAALQENATEELARRVAEEVKRRRLSAPRSDRGGRE